MKCWRWTRQRERGDRADRQLSRGPGREVIRPAPMPHASRPRFLALLAIGTASSDVDFSPLRRVPVHSPSALGIATIQAWRSARTRVAAVSALEALAQSAAVLCPGPSSDLTYAQRPTLRRLPDRLDPRYPRRGASDDPRRRRSGRPRCPLAWWSTASRLFPGDGSRQYCDLFVRIGRTPGSSHARHCL